MTDAPDWLLGGAFSEPREVQIEALRRSRGHKGWAHFLDMRLGKTFVALNEFATAVRDGVIEYAIVLSPADYKEDWEIAAKEALWVRASNMALKVNIPVHVADSGKLVQLTHFIRRNECGIIVVGHESARAKGKTLAILRELCQRKAVMMIGDETIAFKNPSSLIAKGAVELAKLCKVRRALTGKPITQGPHDLWMQLRFVGAISGFNYVAFKNQFCETGGFMGKAIVGSRDEEKLQAILDSCSWRARKQDWMKTPGRDYMNRKIEMTIEQQSAYATMDKTFITELQNGVTVSADQIITKLLKMQQIASGFIIDEDGKSHEIVPLEKNPKILSTIKLLEEELTTKLVIFYHFKFSGAALYLSLAKYNPAWLGSPTHNSVQEKAKFNNDASCRVIVCQTRASKFGHNLMGNKDDPCFTSLYYENTYSLDDRSQTEERNQGEGQQQPVTIIDFLASRRDPVVIEALRRKEDVAATVLNYARETGVLPRASQSPL